jgi:hypothetical protein
MSNDKRDAGHQIAPAGADALGGGEDIAEAVRGVAGRWTCVWLSSDVPFDERRSWWQFLS